MVYGECVYNVIVPLNNVTLYCYMCICEHCEQICWRRCVISMSFINYFNCVNNYKLNAICCRNFINLLLGKPSKIQTNNKKTFTDS